MQPKPNIHSLPKFGILGLGLQQEFENNGYLVFKDAFPSAKISNIKNHITKMVREFQPENFFSLEADEQNPATEKYLCESANKISFFFEKDAFDSDGKLKKSKNRAIAKIGHALHDLDPVFSNFFRREELMSLCISLGMAKPRLLQSMCIFKQPHIGAKVAPHQDGSFLITEPESTIGLWIALEDATLDNGCLWVAPSKHDEPLRKKFGRKSGNLVMETLVDTPMPECTVPLVVRAGSLVVLHNRVPHTSKRNDSPVSRLALTLHLVDGACKYSEENWLQRSAKLPLQGFES